MKILYYENLPLYGNTYYINIENIIAITRTITYGTNHPQLKWSLPVTHVPLACHTHTTRVSHAPDTRDTCTELT